jgi:mannose-6-phosphate isomerase-like protein (cupin superfamily)
VSGDGDDRLAEQLAGRLLAPAGAEFVLGEWQDPGGGHDPPLYIAPLHIHHRDDEAWYVLDGALRFRRGDDVVEATAGGAVLAPRGTPHTYWNPRRDRARYVIVMTPTIRRLIDALHPRDEGVTMADVFRAHDSTLIG